MQDGNSERNCSYQLDILIFLILKSNIKKKRKNYKTNLNFSLLVPQQIYLTQIIHFEKKLFDENP